jgi:outer membrane protein assembly factor BamE (lipoprotein component of BamABCDE complex)
MYNLKYFIIFLVILISSCSEKIKNSGISSNVIKQVKIEIGKTTKKDLNAEYGPPFFESVFNNDVIYYISHSSSYKNFKDRKTKNLIVLEIALDKSNIVKKVNKYSENNIYNVKVSNKERSKTGNSQIFWKQILGNIRKRNVED